MSAPARRPRAAVLAACAVLLAAPAVARATGVATRLALDNDQFNFWQTPADRPDFGYTHGTELALHFPAAPHALARLAPAWLIGRAREGGPATGLEVLFRQTIYAPFTNPADRPYAGWLEAAVGLSHATDRASRQVLLHAGVTGPPSLAGQVQRYFHRRFERAGVLPDWSHQLPFEPGMGLEASGAWTTTASPPGSAWRAAFGPTGRARLGTYAIDLRLGIQAAFGLAPPRPWPADRPGAGPSLYVRAAPRVDFVARDEFLDGTLFRESRGPGSKAVVPESEIAFGAGWGHARLEWAVFRRGKEFEAQPILHTYSSVAFSWLP